MKDKRFFDGLARRGRQLELLRDIAAGDENDEGLRFLKLVRGLGGVLKISRRAESVRDETDQFSMQWATRFLCSA